MEKLASDFKGLSEPVRVRLLAMLTRGELCVCDLMAVLDLPQSTVSRHVSFLRNGGWVSSRRKGKWVYYRIDVPRGDIQARVMDILREELPTHPDMAEDFARLDTHLANKTSGACS